MERMESSTTNCMVMVSRAAAVLLRALRAFPCPGLHLMCLIRAAVVWLQGLPNYHKAFIACRGLCPVSA